jgi:hypothetical protein
MKGEMMNTDTALSADRYSSNNALANYLVNFETRSEQAARQNLETAMSAAGMAPDAYTDPERRAIVKLEQLKLIGDLSLAEVLLRGKIIKEIEDDALWSIHPNRYATMQEAATAQGISISEYSNIRDLYNIVFPYLTNVLGMNLALVWEEVGKSNLRELTPYLVRAITGENSQSHNVENFINRMTEEIAASAEVSDIPISDEQVQQEVVRQLMTTGRMTNREVRQRIRRGNTARIPVYVLELNNADTPQKIVVSVVDEDQYGLIQRRLRGVIQPTPTIIQDFRRSALGQLFIEADL